MHTTIRYVLLTALRDRLFLGLMIGVVFAAYVSSVLGSTALVENTQMKMAFAAASARIILMVGLMIFICFHVRHAFDSKEIDVFLSRPMTRLHLLLSYWLGFSLVALLLVLPSLGVLAFLQYSRPADGGWLPILVNVNVEGFVVWAVSVLCESLLVVGLALFASLTLKSGVTSVMASLGFYVVSRMMGFFVATADSTLVNKDEWNTLLTWSLKAVSTIFPRLDFFGQTEWIIYGVKSWEPFILSLTQMVVFLPLLLVMAAFDFQRKQF